MSPKMLYNSVAISISNSQLQLNFTEHLGHLSRKIGDLKFHGGSMRRMLFFNFASCEPLIEKFTEKSCQLN